MSRFGDELGMTPNTPLHNYATVAEEIRQLAATIPAPESAIDVLTRLDQNWASIMEKFGDRIDWRDVTRLHGGSPKLSRHRQLLEDAGSVETSGCNRLTLDN